MTGLIKKHWCLFRQLPPDATQDKIDREQSRVIARAYTFKLFARTYARHVWDIDTLGVVMLGTEYVASPHYARGDRQRFMRETGTGDFKANFNHVVGGTNRGMCGQAMLPGPNSATFGDNQACGIKTDLHEGFGHCNGLNHASTLNLISGRRAEYGGTDTIMGNGQPISGLNSVELVNLGLISERDITRVTGNAQVLLRPVELHSDALHDGDHKHAIITKGHRTFHVSIRKARGWRYMPPGGNSEMLYVHEAERSGHSLNFTPNMRYPNDAMVLKDAGIEVEYLSYDDERAVVNIITDDSKPRPKDLPIPKGFPPALKAPGPEHTGGWYDRDYNGQGFELHVKDSQVALYWYTFNQYSKSRRFYYAQGSIDDLLQGATLYTTDNGTWMDPAKHELISVGKIQFSIDDDQTALVRWNTREHGNGACRLTQLMRSGDSELTGAYMEPTRKGEGFNLHFFDDRLVMYWYTYGSADRKAPVNRVDITTKQRWYLGEGKLNEVGSYDIRLYEVSNHIWMTLDDDAGTGYAGEATLNINNLRLTFNLNTDTLKGRGDYQLTRLF